MSCFLKKFLAPINNSCARCFTGIVLLVLFFSSCKKDIPPQKPGQLITNGSSGKVYVLCEGNFMSANASVTQLDLTNGAIVSDIFKTQNNNAQLGDVLQSMCSHNGNYYLVLNNSGKIIIVNKYNFIYSGSISGLTSPRFFLPVSNNKAYVSDLYANAISVINLGLNAKTSSIPLNGWSEEMALSYGNVFVTNKKTNYIYVINSASDVIIDSLNVGYGSSSIAEDANGKLWVLCSGNPSQNIKASLSRINPATKTIDTTFVFPSSSNSPYKLRMNGAKDNMFFLDYNGVYRMNISSGILPASPVIAQGTKTFYGIGVDPQDGTIYVTDAIDFNQDGKIYRYNSAGILIDIFFSGIIPGDFYFDK